MTEKMTISVPRETLTDKELGRLHTITGNYGRLIRKALKSRTATITVTDEEIIFPWFDTPQCPEELSAYTELVNKLCEEAKRKKTVRKKAAPSNGNDKYTFRCFLLRLGFIGPEYKASRKVLLGNLTGNSAFAKPKATEE